MGVTRQSLSYLVVGTLVCYFIFTLVWFNRNTSFLASFSLYSSTVPSSSRGGTSFWEDITDSDDEPLTSILTKRTLDGVFGAGANLPPMPPPSQSGGVKPKTLRALERGTRALPPPPPPPLRRAGPPPPRTVHAQAHPHANAQAQPRTVLITGTHRSGTTFVGQVLSHIDKAFLSYEPFNPRNKMFKLMPNALPPPYPDFHWYEYVNDAYPAAKRAKLDTYLHTMLGLDRPDVDVRIIKDPLALMSVNHFAEKYDARPLFTIRHPAAFVESLIRARWSHNFSDFLAQPSVMEDYLPDLSESIVRHIQRKSGVDARLVLWGRWLKRAGLNNSVLLPSVSTPRYGPDLLGYLRSFVHFAQASGDKQPLYFLARPGALSSSYGAVRALRTPKPGYVHPAAGQTAAELLQGLVEYEAKVTAVGRLFAFPTRKGTEAAPPPGYDTLRTVRSLLDLQRLYVYGLRESEDAAGLESYPQAFDSHNYTARLGMHFDTQPDLIFFRGVDSTGGDAFQFKVGTDTALHEVLHAAEGYMGRTRPDPHAVYGFNHEGYVKTTLKKRHRWIKKTSASASKLIPQHQCGLYVKFQEPHLFLVESGVLLWKALNSVIASYLKEHPEWLVVRNEDLILHPMRTWGHIFDYLDVPFAPALKQKIAGMSANPGSTRKFYERLSPRQVEYIRVATQSHPMAQQFYGEEDDWITYDQGPF